LRKAHGRLEHRVEERTTELRIINEKLWREIVVRKRIEEELREAELRYRTVADFTHDWEYWETPDGKLSYVSPSCERITGYSAEDFLANSQLINEIVEPEDRPVLGEHRHESNKVLAPQNIEFRIRTKDGDLLWIEHVCQPVTDTHGTFLGVRASNRDITIRKQAEKNLRDTLSLLGATLESTADGIVVVDKAGKIISYNQKFLQMWGIPDTIIATRSDDEVLDFIGDQFIDREGFFTNVKELYSRPDIQSFDILTLKDGKVFERYSQPQKIGTSIIGRVWSFRDVTERHLAEDALRESEQLLLQAHKMEAIGRLAAGVAHEINNPLAIINEKAGLMKDILDYSPDSGSNREKFLGLLSAIFESVNRCRTITHRLLGFSRRTEISNALFNLNDALREVVQFLEKEIFFRNIHFEMNLREDLPNVISDKGQFEQVVLNILNNAIDVVEKGGRIEISTDVKDDNAIQVSVSDSGPGIPPDVLKHIFEPFFTTKEKGKGTGLGLSISYGIVQKLGGTIIVKSEVNRGTTFFIEIPTKAPGA
jgi:PAS domain S-box-containing protein